MMSDVNNLPRFGIRVPIVAPGVIRPFVNTGGQELRENESNQNNLLFS
jgi:hypothetical protein